MIIASPQSSPLAHRHPQVSDHGRSFPVQSSSRLDSNGNGAAWVVVGTYASLGFSLLHVRTSFHA